MTMEKPVGFLKLEMYVVLEMKILSSGFAQLERDWLNREVDLNNFKKSIELQCINSSALTIYGKKS